jgi:hypothetical protein
MNVAARSISGRRSPAEGLGHVPERNLELVAGGGLRRG